MYMYISPSPFHVVGIYAILPGTLSIYSNGLLLLSAV